MCLCVHVSNHNYDMTPHRKHPQITGVSAQLTIPLEPTTPDNGTRGPDPTMPENITESTRFFSCLSTPVTPPINLTFSPVTGGGIRGS